MELKKLAAKIAQYNERLESGKASKVKPKHVRQVLDKLQSKALSLQAEISSTDDADSLSRLKIKLKIAHEQISRAQTLLEQIE